MALSGCLIEYAAPGYGFLKVLRLKGSAGHLLGCFSAPSGFLCLAQASGDHRKQGDGAPAVKQPPGRNGEVEQRALFQQGRVLAAIKG